MKYTLKNKIAYPCDDLLEWGKFMESGDRIVAKTQIDEVLVSTVFLGLDHNFGPGEPLLFETMIFTEDSSGEISFKGAVDGFVGRMKRDSNWGDAEETHRVACASIREQLDQAKERTNNLIYQAVVTADEEAE